MLPASARPTRLTRLASVVRADNPGPMTLDGTRSYLLAAPGSPTRVVVDPGPDDVAHLSRLAAGAQVELVLVTHRHADHTAGSARLHEHTGAPVRAADPAHCHGGAPLAGGQTIEAAGLLLEVLATPGHTADSMCFVLPDDGALTPGGSRTPGGAHPADAQPHDTGPGTAHPGRRAAPSTTSGAVSGTDGPHLTVLTGDTVLGRGTTVIAEPDGTLGAYLASLDLLEERAAGGRAVGLPGHGPLVPDLAATLRAYRAHRHERLAQVQAALDALGGDASADAVTRHVYADVDPSVRGAARQSVVAQLAFLRDERG